MGASLLSRPAGRQGLVQGGRVRCLFAEPGRGLGQVELSRLVRGDVRPGPVADQPGRPRTPPGVGTPLRATGPQVDATRRDQLIRDNPAAPADNGPITTE